MSRLEKNAFMPPPARPRCPLFSYLRAPIWESQRMKRSLAGINFLSVRLVHGSMSGGGSPTAPPLPPAAPRPSRETAPCRAILARGGLGVRGSRGPRSLTGTGRARRQAPPQERPQEERRASRTRKKDYPRKKRGGKQAGQARVEIRHGRETTASSKPSPQRSAGQPRERRRSSAIHVEIEFSFGGNWRRNVEGDIH